LYFELLNGLLVGCGPTANYLFCFAKKGNPKKATVDSPLRGAYATLQHNLCITKNGKVLKLAFGSDNNTFLSIFCEAQITSSQTGEVKNNDHQRLFEKYEYIKTVTTFS
jgi:hypothetical protein